MDLAQGITTLIAPTPFVGTAVEEIRAAHDWSAALGVPAHITLVGPFLSPDAISGRVHDRLATIFRDHPKAFVSLSSFELLGDAACLTPSDPHPLEAIGNSIRRAWPELPGRSSYHVTVARDVTKEAFDDLHRHVEPSLPFDGVLTEAWLLVRRNDGQVRRPAVFTFA